MTDTLAIVLTGRPELVRLYEDRAEVTRVANGELRSGLAWYALGDISPFVDDRSVRVKVNQGELRVISARVNRQVKRADAPASHRALEEETRALSAKVEAAMASQGRAKARNTQVDALLRQWVEGLQRVPALSDAQVKAGWEEALNALSHDLSESQSEALKRLHEREDLLEELEALHGKLRRSETEHPQVDARIEVQAEAQKGEGSATFELQVTYRTPCALWRPEHIARLSGQPETTSKEAPATIEFSSHAVVWQATGEDWENVQLEFSTARPARAAVAPKLKDDQIRSRKKTDEERRTVQVEITEEAVAVAGVTGESRINEMPGVDDGGEPLLYRAARRTSLRSDGQPVRVELTKFSAEAQLSRILVPERSMVGHWRATGTLGKEGPLLAGPVRIGRGRSMMGRSRLDFVAKGEPFEMGFGPDDGLRVRRAVDEERDRVPITGTQKIERKVKLYISNVSEQSKETTVLERIPVSEIEDVEIQLLASQGWTVDRRDGFLKQRITVEPRGRRTLEYRYEIKAKSSVNLPF